MLDLVFALSIFMILLAVLYSGWFVKIQSASQELSEFKASMAAQSVLISLSDSPGFPSNWAAQNISPNSDSLKGIGIVSSHSQIDPQKLKTLEYFYNLTSTYNNSKIKMGIAPYDSDIRIYYLNGTNISIMGSPPSSTDNVLSSAQKPAVYNNQTVIIRVRIWE